MRVVIRTPRPSNSPKTIFRDSSKDKKLNRLPPKIQPRRIAPRQTPNPHRYGINSAKGSGIPGPNFPFADKRRIWPERHSIKSRNAPPQFSIPARQPEFPAQTFAQKSRAILKTPSILPFPRMRPKKFMPQISMAMFHINKIKNPVPQAMRPARQKIPPMIPPISPSVSTGKSADNPSRRSRIGCRNKILGSPRVCELGLQYRPECVSCNPTSNPRVPSQQQACAHQQAQPEVAQAQPAYAPQTPA